MSADRHEMMLRALFPRDKEWEAACLRYLWLIFNRAPDNFIKMAADQVYKHMLMPGVIQPNDDRTVH